MTVQVYVGTYAKYNQGSINGAWVDLEGHDAESFYEVCSKLHSDEEDPEFMFQDFEGFPDSYYGECHLDDALWDWLELDADDRELLEAYQNATGNKGTIDEARDAFYGKFDSDTDLAYEYVESTGMFHDVPDSISAYFDYERFGRDLSHDFMTYGEFYFFNH